MTAVHPRPSADAYVGRRRVVGALATLAFAVAALACAAAADSATRSSASGLSLCTAAKSVARDIVQSANLTSEAAATPAQLKTIYTTIVNAEPRLLASASGAIKTHLRLALAFVNVVNADFKKVNWRIAGLTPQLPALLPAAQRVEPHFKALQAYFDTTCHLKV